MTLYDDREIGGLLLYASGYVLATTMIWNDIFQLADEAVLITLREEGLAARDERGKPN